MRKRYSLIVCGGFLLALAVTCVVWGCNQGPFYHWKPLDAWLNILDSGDPAQKEAAAEAVDKIGTNGLPRLVTMLRATEADIPLRYTYRGYLQNLMGTRIEEIAARDLHQWAILGFRMIGSNSVPTLIPLLSDRNPEVKSEAAHVLAVLGPAAAPSVPALKTALRDKDLASGEALLALAQIGFASQEALPDLIELLRAHRRIDAKTDTNQAALVLATIDKIDDKVKQTNAFVNEVWTELKHANRLLVIVDASSAVPERSLRRAQSRPRPGAPAN